MNKIAHIGFGAFHRAHQLVYAQALKNSDQFPWRYVAISLFSEHDLVALKQQDYCFHVLEKSDHRSALIHVDVVGIALHPNIDGIDRVITSLSDPDVAIISLTITEKGYCMQDGFQVLHSNEPLIAHDIENPQMPVSAIGVIVAALQKRQQNAAGAVTIMSCDNIPQNGEVTRRAVLQFAQVTAPGLMTWIEKNVAFPSSMVDRIVPAMNAESRNVLQKEVGREDNCGVLCEPYTQWIIEDNFKAGRPAWETVGVSMVEDVKPFETMKLRLLNGAHSWLAYVGYLAEFETVADAIRHPHMRRAIRHLMLDEQAPTFRMPLSADGRPMDIEMYSEQLLERFANRQLPHRTWQIAMDGSQKLPQRWLQSLQVRLEQHQPCPVLELGIAAWLRYISGTNCHGVAIDVRDPWVEYFRECSVQCGKEAVFAKQILMNIEIFSNIINIDKAFIARVVEKFKALLTRGVLPTVEAELKQHYN